MPSVFSHGVAAAALATAFPRASVPARIVVAGVICSMAPDLDVLDSCFALPTSNLAGHRGLTHSLAFAAAMSGVVLLAILLIAPTIRPFWTWVYLLLASVSHGVLDAMTDKAGLGIPFFGPFDSTRYFFPFAPIAMSPIGTDFFSKRGVMVLLSELRWVWMPSLLFALILISFRRFVTSRSPNHRPA